MNTSLSTLRETEVRIPCGNIELEGDLVVPAGADGIVVFVHGSGSSRRSPRNRGVAAEMHRHRLATLLFDLLTPAEAAAEADTGKLRFDIPLLTDRLVEVTRWLRREEVADGMRVGYFGSSTGAAAALAAAARVPRVKAVVSRGGRTDLAGPDVGSVRAATLMIAGGLDQAVLEWNQQTFEKLTGVTQLSVISGAGHLFEEPGALEKVAELAASWFGIHLARPEG